MCIYICIYVSIVHTDKQNVCQPSPPYIKWYDHLGRIQDGSTRRRLSVTLHVHFLFLELTVETEPVKKYLAYPSDLHDTANEVKIQFCFS
jgi:hypothetical protein